MINSFDEIKSPTDEFFPCQPFESGLGGRSLGWEHFGQAKRFEPLPVITSLPPIRL